MIDTLMKNKEKALKRDTLQQLGVTEGNYALVTLHRPSNVDDAQPLQGIFEALVELASRLDIIFPAHPRTLKMFEAFDLMKLVEQQPRIRMVEPVGYLDFLCLMARSKLLLTDSGGIQEETTVLGVPCLTLRFNTERPITLTQGTNQLVGNDKEKILEAAEKILSGQTAQGRIPDLWDGGAAERITDILLEKL